MNTLQSEIADKLLQFVEGKGGTQDVDQVHHFLEGFDIDMLDESLIRDSLIDEGFLQWWGDQNYRVRITRIGSKAARVGIDNYYRQEAEDKQSVSIHGENINFRGTVGSQQITKTNLDFSHSPTEKYNISQPVTPLRKSGGIVSWWLKYVFMPVIVGVVVFAVWEAFVRPYMVSKGYIQ